MEAQSANDTQKIVGTWVNEKTKKTYVFNANGTGNSTYNGKTQNIFWGVSASGEIFITDNDDADSGNYKSFSILPDGRRMSIGNSLYQKK